jgi:hypothetical protein
MLHEWSDQSPATSEYVNTKLWKAITYHSGSLKGFKQTDALVYEGDSKSKGKIHLTAVIQVTVSNFTYYFST